MGLIFTIANILAGILLGITVYYYFEVERFFMN